MGLGFELHIIGLEIALLIKGFGFELELSQLSETLYTETLWSDLESDLDKDLALDLSLSLD